MDLQRQILQDPLLSSKYQFIQKLGQGCFGKIYKVKNRQLKIHTALKLQVLESKNKKSMLENEAQIFKLLKGKPYVPQFYSFGLWSLGAYIQIEILVKDLNCYVQKTFTFDEISAFAAKLIQSLSVLHNHGVIHQDIKPQNIMMNSKQDYHFIDFGISKRIKQTIVKPESLGRRTRGFIGTPRYASIQAHRGMQQSKKDDLQSLMYNIAYLYFKKLPWLALKVSGSRKIQEIKNTKIKTAENVFQQMGRPFYTAFQYIKKLQHMQEPNYKFLIANFRRTHSMIVDPIKQLELQNKRSQQQRPNSKRRDGKKYSLNMSDNCGKYLELPLMTKEGISQRNLTGDKPDKTLAEGSNNMTISMFANSMNGSKAISIRAYNESDQITNDEIQTQKDMDLKEDDNQQPQVPDISKFFSPLTLKNPFTANN